MQFFLLTGSFLVLMFFLALDSDWRQKRNNDPNLLYIGFYVIGWVFFSQGAVRLINPRLGENRLPGWLLCIFVAIFVLIFMRLIIRPFIPWIVRVWPLKA